MELDGPVVWHMHIGKQMITKIESFDHNTSFRVEDQHGGWDYFNKLEEAIEYAQAVEGLG